MKRSIFSIIVISLLTGILHIGCLNLENRDSPPVPTRESTLEIAINSTEEPAIEPSPSPEPFLRFDGLYQEHEDTFTSYLRFYDDNTVISVLSTGTADEIISWFDKDFADVGVGTYSIIDNTITFFTVDNSQSDYSGNILFNALELSIYYHYNGNTETLIFNFVELDI